MPRDSLDDLGDLQKAVMEAAWDLGEATVQQVRDAIGGARPPAYTTVLSVMQKLEKAGWLDHRAEGRTYVYRPTKTRSEVGSRSLRSFMKNVFRGDPLLLFQHLIDDESLSEGDLKALKAMIDSRRKERRDA